jgi:hypothetical protein
VPCMCVCMCVGCLANVSEEPAAYKVSFRTAESESLECEKTLLFLGKFRLKANRSRAFRFLKKDPVYMR